MRTPCPFLSSVWYNTPPLFYIWPPIKIGGACWKLRPGNEASNIPQSIHRAHTLTGMVWITTQSSSTTSALLISRSADGQKSVYFSRYICARTSAFALTRSWNKSTQNSPFFATEFSQRHITRKGADFKHQQQEILDHRTSIERKVASNGKLLRTPSPGTTSDLPDPDTSKTLARKLCSCRGIYLFSDNLTTLRHVTSKRYRK